MMPVTICSVIPQNQNQKLKQKSFKQKSFQKSFKQKSFQRFNVDGSLLPAWCAGNTSLHSCLRGQQCGVNVT